MKIVTHFDQIPKVEGPIALTLGVYDGVHLGHQFLFKELGKYTRRRGTNTVLTFVNHPTTLLTPNNPIPSITSLDHRLHLLESSGFDLAILLPFDQAIANLPYDTFIKDLYARLPFDYLILGADACFGKNRVGNPSAVYKLSKVLNFHAEYLNKRTYHKNPISSGRIRRHLAQGDLKKVKKLLGRPYSIRVPFKHPVAGGQSQHRLSFDLEGLSPLPSAVYAVDIGKIPSIAFYHATKRGNDEGIKLSITLYFEQNLPEKSHITLNFVSYLHDELDPELSTQAKLLETLLSPQVSLL